MSVDNQLDVEGSDSVEQSPEEKGGRIDRFSPRSRLIQEMKGLQGQLEVLDHND